MARRARRGVVAYCGPRTCALSCWTGFSHNARADTGLAGQPMVSTPYVNHGNDGEQPAGVSGRPRDRKSGWER